MFPGSLVRPQVAKVSIERLTLPELAEGLAKVTLK